MRDRAMQALHALALAPVAETCADANPYDSARTDYFTNRRRTRRTANLDRRFIEEHG